MRTLAEACGGICVVAFGLYHADLPDELSGLPDLALDLRWTWSHGSDSLWRQLDVESWKRTRNPWAMLQSISRERLTAAAKDQEFVAQLRRLAAQRLDYLSTPFWCDRAYPECGLRRVAYFSMEFGLGEALPLYAGGLGILAGDHLKTASDLGLPLVGIGILYQQGYYRQVIDEAGIQREIYPYNDPMSLPVRPVADADRGWLRIPIALPGRTLLLRVWRADAGRVPLYLLDSNDPLLEGSTIERLQAEDAVMLNRPAAPYVGLADLRFKTPSGRIEIYKEDLRKHGAELPYYREPIEASPDNPLHGQYPLTLLFSHSRHRIHSTFANLSKAKQREPEPLVEIHHDDAHQRGLVSGQMVRVYNDRGFVELKCRLNADLRPGVVVIAEGSWVRDFTNGEPYSLTHEQVSATSDNYAFFDTLVEVTAIVSTAK